MFQTVRAAPRRADLTKFAPIQAGCLIGEAARAFGVSAKMIRLARRHPMQSGHCEHHAHYAPQHQH